MAAIVASVLDTGEPFILGVQELQHGLVKEAREAVFARILAPDRLTPWVLVSVLYSE